MKLTSVIMLALTALKLKIERMGRKKFRMVVRKNEERKRARPAELKVSISKSTLPVESIDDLLAQLAMPLPWIVQAEAVHGKLIICQLDATTEPPTVRYSITIRENFTWLLSVHGNNVSPLSCHALAGFPDNLDSVAKVMQITSVVQHSRICVGNSDSRFLDVARRRDGVFKDHSGKADSVQLSCITVILNCKQAPRLWHALILQRSNFLPSGIANVRCCCVPTAEMTDAINAPSIAALCIRRAYDC